MMRPAQLRMARAGLNWTVRELAERARANKNTISRYEAGKEILSGTLEQLERVLMEEGVVFIGEDAESGPGVRLPKPATTRKPAQDRNRKTSQSKPK